jgi:hypothetical protein
VPELLTAEIRDENPYCSLYSDGLYAWKTRDEAKKATLISYSPGSVLFLYYTYPAHREAACVRYVPESETAEAYPCLDRKVETLFTVGASRVDKLRRAVGYINKNCSPAAYRRSDAFFCRLYNLILRHGKLNYAALTLLAEECP